MSIKKNIVFMYFFRLMLDYFKKNNDKGIYAYLFLNYKK